jgi:hydrogenase nickel incorporation protein HypA/HybF
MHEASLMTGLMRRIEEVAAADRAVKVVGVSVRLGALSHMSAEHFTEHFEQAAAGSIAEGASLQIELSEDQTAPWAQDIVLESVEIET